MNIRTRKITLYRIIASILLFLSLGLTAFSLSQVIIMKPEKTAIDLIALSLTATFAIGQIILILRGGKKESHLLDIAFNTDNTVNKLALVMVLIGTTVGLTLEILSIVILCGYVDGVSRFCSMLIILTIASYLLLNCFIYLLFTLIFRKRKLTLEDYAK